MSAMKNRINFFTMFEIPRDSWFFIVTLEKMEVKIKTKKQNNNIKTR